MPGRRLRRKRIQPADQVILKVFLEIVETRVILKRASRQNFLRLVPERFTEESVIT
jgi:hypothetical protein